MAAGSAGSFPPDDDISRLHVPRVQGWAPLRYEQPPGLSGPEPVGAVDDLRIPNAAGGQQTLRSTGQPAPVRRRWCFDSTAAAGCYSTSTYDASCRGLCNQTGAVVVQVSHEIGLDEAPDAYDKFDRRVDGA